MSKCKKKIKPFPPPRIPEDCPEGFFRYTVVKGDTIFKLSQRLGVDIGLIIANNSHIPDPSLIFPGDVLCIPIPIFFPCRVELFPVPDTPPTQRGEVLVEQLPAGQQQAIVVGRNLVPPTVFGDFDAYEGFIEFEGLGTFGFLLTETAPGFWEGSIIIPRPLFFAGTAVSIRPANLETGVSGPPILSRNLFECAIPICLTPPKG